MIERLLEHGGGHQEPTLAVVHAMAYQIDVTSDLIEAYPQLESRAGERLYAATFLDAIGLSAHVLVAPNGERIRCRRDDEIAWHAKGHNENSVGIEVLVPGVFTYGDFLARIAEPWPSQAQLLSTAAQLHEWSIRWPIKRIEGHSTLSPERKQDPGKGFPWGRLMALLANPEKAA